MKKWNYFEGVKNLQDVKNRYKELVYKFHPDRQNGNLEIMKEINNEYELVFNYIKEHPQNEQEEKYYKYANVADGYREILEQVIFIPDISIEICGSWIWLGQNTKPYKDIIKNAGFEYASKKQMWFWKPYATKKAHKGYKGWDMQKIRDTFGSEEVQKKEKTTITGNTAKKTRKKKEDK